MTSRTRRISIAGAIAALVAVLIAGTRLLKHELFIVGPGTRAPAFSAATLDSPALQKSLSDFRGDVILLNVWATWCGPCRVEMPSMQKLHEALGPKGLKVVAVSVDQPGFETQIRDFVAEYGLTFEILHDPKANIRDTYQITGYPETFIIGKDGLIRRKLIGAADWNSPGNRALIEHLLAEPSE